MAAVPKPHTSIADYLAAERAGKTKHEYGVIELPAIGCTLRLADVYKKVEFEDETDASR